MTVQLPDDEYTDEEEYHIEPDFQNPITTEFIEPDQDSEGYKQQTSLDNFPLQPSVSGPGDVPQPEPRHFPSEDVTQPQRPLPKHAILQVYPNRLKDVPPHTSGGQVFSVEEKINFDSGGKTSCAFNVIICMYFVSVSKFSTFVSAVIHYSTDNKETCERSQTQCSQNARCTDYSTGFCCQCNSGFYGNGQHCLPNGKTGAGMLPRMFWMCELWENLLPKMQIFQIKTLFGTHFVLVRHAVISRRIRTIEPRLAP